MMNTTTGTGGGDVDGNEQQLIKTITTMLTNHQNPQHLQPFIPHLTLPIIISILSWKPLHSHPQTIVSFFKWFQTNAPSTLSVSPKPLLTLLPPLLSHRKFSDAKSLLLDFISSHHPRHSLHSRLLRSDHSIPKLVLDTSIAAYVFSQQPQLAFDIFNKMRRLRFRPNLLTCNTLLNTLVRSNSSHSILLPRQVFQDSIKLGVQPNTNAFNILIHGYCSNNNFNEDFRLINQMGEFSCCPDNVT
ncbi:unnamed protein product [Lathyrus sativus]|nr:unnamed protein product [Lathyrus sativus]